MFSSPTPKEIQEILVRDIGITVERFPRSTRKQLANGHKQIMMSGGTLYDSAIHYAMFAVSQMRDPEMITNVANACHEISERASLNETRKIVDTLRQIAADVQDIEP